MSKQRDEPPFEIFAQQHGRPSRLIVKCFGDPPIWLCLTIRELDSQMMFRTALKNAVTYAEPPIACPPRLMEPVDADVWDAWFKKAVGDFHKRTAC